MCLQVYEPYIIQVYNSSIGLPNTVNITSRSADFQPSDREKMLGAPLSDSAVTRKLNSTGLRNVYVLLCCVLPFAVELTLRFRYIVTHQNSINSLLKDNGPEAGYRPSPSVSPINNTICH